LIFVILGFKIYFSPVAIVLPHHNLVQSTRQQFLKIVASRRLITKKIILISPDHFSADQRQINTSDQNWNLSTGLIRFQDLNLGLPVNNSLLNSDHGIYNPLADLKTYFPHATVYPILIGQKVPISELKSLLFRIKSVCGLDCLVVASVDFSHYLPATLADTHDAYTLKILNNLDTDLISNVEVDSPQSLYLLTKFTISKSAQKWNLFAHTNSGFITNNPDAETTTHVFGYFSLGHSPLSVVQTSVTTPVSLIRSQNQTTVGDRFFYGTDNYSVDTTINFVVATITTPRQIIKSYLPIKNSLFILGPEKKQLIKKYFDSLPDDQNLTKDYFWGRLIYGPDYNPAAVTKN
jgi:AmmeMemoRadiSam system protein B